MKNLVFVLLMFGSVLAFAAGGGEHGDDHIPFSTIAFQAINLGILLVIIFFAVRKSITAFFKSRYASYTEQAAKTEEAAKAAEIALSDIKNRIQKLQSGEQSSLETAKTEAALLKNKIIEEARAQSEKVKVDAQLIVNTEVNNAKNEIRKEIINASIDMAKNNIKSSADTISKKFEKGFLSDISKTKNQVIS